MKMIGREESRNYYNKVMMMNVSEHIAKGNQKVFSLMKQKNVKSDGRLVKSGAEPDCFSLKCEIS